MALLRPRQSGKATLALEVAEERGNKAIYLDLENSADQRRLDNPVAVSG